MKNSGTICPFENAPVHSRATVSRQGKRRRPISGLRFSPIIILCFSVFLKANAQFSDQLFYDTIVHLPGKGMLNWAMGDGKYVYMFGGSFSKENPLPTVMKVDTSGQTVWTAFDNDNYERFIRIGSSYCNGGFKSGNNVFVNVSRPNTLFEVWNIDDSSGALLWKKSFEYHPVLQIIDYDSSYLLALTDYNGLTYWVLDKHTGAVVFTKPLIPVNVMTIYNAGLFVDASHNIMVSWLDSCRKFRDIHLTDQAWVTSNTDFNGHHELGGIMAYSGSYILTGNSYIRAVDTLTGAIRWTTGVIPGNDGSQTGSSCNAAGMMMRDSMVYIRWISPSVGGVDLKKGFTLTCVNMDNGAVRYNVAHDFTGIPPNPTPSASSMDWPISFCMDDAGQIFMTGSYDNSVGPGAPGNWGIMKINGRTGAKIYEATITDDSTTRFDMSQGLMAYYYKGKMFCAGNINEKSSLGGGIRPLLVGFDTSSVYNERFRVTPSITYRHPSALAGIVPVSKTKMVLLKKVGQKTIIELRNINHQLVWTKVLSQPGRYVRPGIIAVHGDTTILVGAFSYAEHPEYKIFPGPQETLILYGLDTLGNVRTTKELYTANAYDLDFVQVYTDTNGHASFIFRDKYESEGSFDIRSIMHNNPASTYLNAFTDKESWDPGRPPMRINPVQYYNGDTMVIHGTSNLRPPLGFFHSPVQVNNFYHGHMVRDLRDFAKIYSTVKIDSVSYFITGRDGAGHAFGSRYCHRLADPVVWTRPLTGTGTMFNADTAGGYLYAVSARDTGSVSVTKINAVTGVPVWDYIRIPARGHNYVPVDFRYDHINNYIITGGYYSDSTLSGVGKRYFSFTLDSAGHIIREFLQAGNRPFYNQVNVTNVLQNGTHVYGGQKFDPQFGIAGFYNSNCYVSNLVPAVSITASSTVACTGDSVHFTATAIHEGNAPVFQWKKNGVTVGGNGAEQNIAVQNNNDQVQVVMTSNADCIQTANASSNIVVLSVTSQIFPSISISGLTNLQPGETSDCSAQYTNGGISPSFQWQDSTALHSWQNINRETRSSISYTPAATGVKLRCVLHSSSACANPAFKNSNVLVFIINGTTGTGGPGNPDRTHFRIYPNPVNQILIVDSLNTADHWQTLEIFDLNGRPVLPVLNVQRKTTVQINTSGLKTGLYLIVLKRKSGQPAVRRLMKL